MKEGLLKLTAIYSSPIRWEGRGRVRKLAVARRMQAQSKGKHPPRQRPHPHPLLPQMPGHCPYSLSSEQSQPQPHDSLGGVWMVQKGLMKCTGLTIALLAGNFL